MLNPARLVSGVFVRKWRIFSVICIKSSNFALKIAHDMFSEKEKIAIVSLLIEMANADEEVLFEELVAFNYICCRLGVDKEIFNLGRCLKAEYAASMLRSLDDEKKIEVGKMLVEIIDADGVDDDKEIRLLNRLCREIGIDVVLESKSKHEE